LPTEKIAKESGSVGQIRDVIPKPEVNRVPARRSLKHLLQFSCCSCPTFAIYSR
jgi:hypothetical protein